MNNSVTSKSAILLKIREIVAKEGLNALSIRRLAKEVGSSVGTIYYYFPSKEELIIEAIESVWEDIFQVDDFNSYDVFSEYIADVFSHISDGIKRYPNFFTLHSIMLKTDDSKAKCSMQIYMEKLRDIMKDVLKKDLRIKKSTFNENFSEDDFISYIISNIMSLITDKSFNKEFFVAVIERVLY